MTRINRITSFLGGLIMVLAALLFSTDTESAMKVISFLLSLSLLLYGIRMMIYFLTMARHMTGGLSILFRAIIVFDLGLFALNLTSLPQVYVMLYLAAMHGFSGIVDIMRARESKQLDAPSWKLSLLHGILDVTMAVLCVIFIDSIRLASYIYAAGLFNSGVIRIIQSFRKTESVYVQ